jgi:hypothetical protein
MGETQILVDAMASAGALADQQLLVGEVHGDAHAGDVGHAPAFLLGPAFVLAADEEQQCLEITLPPGQRLVLSTEVAAFQRALEQSRRLDSSGQITVQRHCAPVLQLTDGLEPGEVVMVFQGTIPNQKGVAVLHRETCVRRHPKLSQRRHEN